MNSHPSLRSIFASISVLLVFSGCSQEPTPPKHKRDIAAVIAQASAAAPAAPVVDLPGGSEAKQIFKTRCVVCHGQTGQGDGPGATALKVKPRNYTDGKWQKSVTDADIENVIVKGGVAVGKDPGMAANPDLKDKPEVVADLRKIVRSFAPKDDPSAPSAAANEKTPEGNAKQAKAKVE